MANSVVLKVALVIVACMVVAAPSAEAAISCGVVVRSLTPCLTYLQRGGPVPSACCNGVRSLNNAARSTPDRQTACGCLKTAASSAAVVQKYASVLPRICSVNLGYNVDPRIDCSK
ncbi:hypothetical protein IFM89_003473 [Coptis chinensis]|uniref:Non-specific lipid-transfer protein n=1 Tax=Coptis chinensis TaxID=261450 RepID=A0A835HAH5_9MAGN|nr:hypothetical protein IFM89_003473 [Coptis chinensis]